MRAVRLGAAVQVVEEAQRKAGEQIEKTEFEKREALEAEMPGFAGIKHHVTQVWRLGSASILIEICFVSSQAS